MNRRVPIETLYLGLYDGPHATPRPSDEGPIFLGIGNLTEDGKLDLSDIRHIAEEDFATWTKRVTPQPGDIVFTYEATLNRYARIPDGFRGCLGRRLALIRPDLQEVNPLFLFYYFFGEDWRRMISKNTLSGSTVDRIPLTTFPTFEVNLPCRSAQDGVASILSAYDDLIENNTRRIKILEEIAQTIYREWFVNFRFPGHEKAKIVESEMGWIPDGWDVVELSSLYNTGSGGTPSRKVDEYFGGSIPWVKTRELADGFIMDTEEKITESGLKCSSAKLFPPRTVLMAMYGATIGKLGILTSSATCNQACCAMTEKVVPFGAEYLFLTLQHRRDDIIGLRMGAAQQNISQEVIRAIRILRPTETVISSFNQLAVAIFDELRVLTQKNINLDRTRDLLLPKLISGEVSVENFEAEVAAQSV
jgi:type I restriction enzyme S subunit